MTTTHTTPSGATAKFDDAFGNLVRAWLVADNLKASGAGFGPRASAAADLMHARHTASEARQALDVA